MSLPRNQRLQKKRDIDNAFRRHRRHESAFFSGRVHKKEIPPGRLLVIVPKKVSKSAVVRNRLRRRVSEWFRQAAKIGIIAADCIVTLKPEAKTASRKSLYAELAKFKRTALL